MEEEQAVRWVNLSERRPEEEGWYVVLWATPYSNGDMLITTQGFDGKKFDKETCGTNYIAFWLEDLTLPYLSREERNKLCN